ncbi:MAG: hypothetical protein IKQ56_09840 [Lachnospiraceae bacterium]|nr:hypothetical protein [Lachnospiraceae bacterium]MCR4946185.1 hypothetical protein [Lachnospiraceae bacterium]
MDSTKIIGFYGIGQTDICIYTASVLQNMGYSVAVYDNSYEGATDFCIPRPAEVLSPVSYKNIDYYRLKKPADRELDYDFICIDMGVWPERQVLSECDSKVLVLDPALSILSKYREYMKGSKVPTRVVLRGLDHDMVPVKKVQHILEVENPFVECFEVLHLSDDDEILRISMQYYGFKDFMHISKDMERIIKGIVEDVTNVTHIVVNKAINSAKRGACA